MPYFVQASTCKFLQMPYFLQVSGCQFYQMPYSVQLLNFQFHGDPDFYKCRISYRLQGASFSKCPTSHTFILHILTNALPLICLIFQIFINFPLCNRGQTASVDKCPSWYRIVIPSLDKCPTSYRLCIRSVDKCATFYRFVILSFHKRPTLQWFKTQIFDKRLT